MRNADFFKVFALILGALLLFACSAFCLAYVFSSYATPQALLAEGGGMSSQGGIFQGLGLKNAPPPESVTVDYQNGIETGANGEPFTM